MPLTLCLGKLDNTTLFNRKILSQYCQNDNSYDFNKWKKIVNNFKEIKKNGIIKSYIIEDKKYIELNKF